MKLKAENKCGLPFIIRPYLQRKGLFVGAVLSVLIVSVLSSCVWTITVNGNEKYTDSQILQLAEAYGIRQGSFRRSIDAKAIREDIKATVDGINWFTVYIDKTAVTIEVLEKTGDNEILDLTTPCNIISDIDGELLKLEVYTGEAALTAGNAVTAGDLLISGVVERADGSSDFVHARGKAVIRTNREIVKTIPRSINTYRLSAENIKSSLYLFSLQIPFGKSELGNIFRIEKSMLEYSNRILPLGIITERSTVLTKQQTELNENQSLLLCEYAVFTEEKIIMKNAETEKKEISIHSNEQGTSITSRYVNHENCGIENYFSVESN